MIRCATLWTKPKWRHEGIEEMASLHCLLWAKHMGTPIVLHTDSKGAEWAKALKLPVEIRVTLDSLPDNLSHAWSAGKLHTYAMYDEPFLHADLDVMLGAPLPRRVMEAEFIVEKAELQAVGAWMERFQMPENWRAAWKAGDTRTFNLGLFGGWNTQVISAYAEKAMRFLNDNIAVHRTTNEWNVTATAEQWGFAREVNPLDVTCYLPSGDEFHAAFGDGVYHHLAGPKTKARFMPDVVRRLSEFSPGQSQICNQVAAQFSHK